VRLLVSKLDESGSVALAHPFNKGFTRAHRCRTDAEIEEVKKGSLQYQAKDIATAPTGHGLKIQGATKEVAVNGDEKVTEDGQVTMVYTTTNYIGLELHEGAKSLDLSWEVDTFKAMCKGWSEYKEELNAINISNIRNVSLPDDVFADGEVKPSRPNKKAKAQHVKKRKANEDTEQPTKRQHTSVAAAG
jgi:poly(A) polymerase